MPRVHALGKVDELLEKEHWWMTGEIDRDEEKRKKTFKATEREEGETSQRHHLCFLVVFFYFGTEDTVEWRKWRSPVLFLFLSPTTTRVNHVVFCFFFTLSWVGWGFLTISWLCLFHHFFHIIPLWAPFLLFFFFFHGRGWPGHTSTAGQPILSLTFISIVPDAQEFPHWRIVPNSLENCIL